MVERLPAELLLRICDDLEFEDLISSAQVCRNWRDIAHDHPSYWRDIFASLNFEASPMKPFLRAQVAQRLSQKPYLPARLELEAGLSPANADEISDIISPALWVNVNRLVTLRLALDIECTVVDLLCRVSAPVLVVFALEFQRLASPGVLLPASIFCGFAPRLKFVALERVDLLTDQAYPAFVGVETVAYTVRSAQHYFPAHIFYCFPAMRLLSVTAGNREVLTAAAPPHSLQRLTVHFHDEVSPTIVRSFLAWIRASTIEEVVVQQLPEEVVPDLPRDLLPPFHLLVGGEMTHIAYIAGLRSLVDDKFRVFSASTTRLALQEAMRVGPIREVTWRLILGRQFFAPFTVFPAVISLRIILEPGESYTVYSASEDETIQCDFERAIATDDTSTDSNLPQQETHLFPNLERVVVSTPAPHFAHVAPVLLSRLLESLCGAGSQVTLVLERVRLPGWCGEELDGIATIL